MNYWSVLKYVLLFVFLFIVSVGVYITQDNSTNVHPDVPQANQSKFNI